MNVSLTPRLEKMVRDKVESGLYNNASEVIREALRLLDERDRRKPFPTVEDLLAEGIASIERGEARTLTPELWSEIRDEGIRLANDGAPVPPHVSGEY